MTEACGKSVDPRILRTRQLLQQALATLLKTRKFDELSVQDITEVATVNRATFYAHYPDKFALLECLVAGRFSELLAQRGIAFNGTCGHALKAIVVSVCDFLVEITCLDDEQPRRIEPQTESAIIRVVRTIILQGITKHPPQGAASPEMIASTASWAIYGGAREWSQTPGRGSAEEAAKTVLTLIASILHPEQAARAQVQETAVL